MSLNKWIFRRENGFLSNRNEDNLLMKRIYRAMNERNFSGDLNNTSKYGAVFNLEFSPNGNILGAACERRTIQLFDTVTTKRVQVILNAHKDNVNCIKFLNERVFASCSDDTTVSLWDMRYLKVRLRNLHGHSNWVKNVEYSFKDNLLVSSGFDGNIYTWDISSHTEQGLIYQKVFHTSGLMRCVLAPDDSKLVICSTGGYLMIIHNLDLTTLHRDLCGFRPGMYRLMQMGQQYIPQAAKFDHVFSKKQKRNRVELVTDFPEGNDAEVILALQIHPYGHAVLSRNISYDEKAEWSCVHNIHEEEVDITEHVMESSLPRKRKQRSLSPDNTSNLEDGAASDVSNEMHYDVNGEQSNIRPTATPLNAINPGMHLNLNTDMPGIAASRNLNGAIIFHRASNLFSPDIWAAEVTVRERAMRQNRSNPYSIAGYNYVYAINSGVMPITRNSPNDESESNTSSSDTNGSSRQNDLDALNTRPISPAVRDESSARANFTTQELAALSHVRVNLTAPSDSLESRQSDGRQIVVNAKKLMYYVLESNQGKGFIKEPCFSSDGRVICSPYDNGIRLLTFTDACSEFPPHTIADDHPVYRPSPLVVQKEIQSHKNTVLCTKFSPREPLLVSGCKNGKISWYYPNL